MVLSRLIITIFPHYHFLTSCQLIFQLLFKFFRNPIRHPVSILPPLLFRHSALKHLVFGDADEYSDYDILIITSREEPDKKDKIEEIETDIFITYSAIINSHLFSEEEIKGLSFEPFIVNALEEGVAA